MPRDFMTDEMVEEILTLEELEEMAGDVYD